MILQDIMELMVGIDYVRVGINVSGVYLYQKKIKDKTMYVSIMDTQESPNLDVVNARSIILQIQSKLLLRVDHGELLNILITDRIQEYRSLSELGTMLWFVDSTRQMLMIYENQSKDLKELRNQLEDLLDRVRESNTLVDQLEKLPICSVILILINVLIYLFMSWFCNSDQYDEIIEHFGSVWYLVKNQGEYYRIVTSMFLHSDFNHLFNNMLVLFFLGQMLERFLSKPKFLTIYFGSGIFAAIVSMVYNMINDRLVLAVGASGAIFGLVGAIAFSVLINKGRFEDISTRQIVLFIFFSIYAGYTAGNVDNAAHIGGFLGGMLLGAIFIRRKNQKERENT